MYQKPYIIAITGGIGSGKSYLAKCLSQHDIAVYDCDQAAKRLMSTNKQLQCELQKLVGKEVFQDGNLQKSLLAKFLLSSEKNKHSINAIVHPIVAGDFMQSDYLWFESAILFESHFDKLVCPTKVVCVVAPIDVRVKRIMQRDGIGEQQALQWINEQMPQKEMALRSDYQVYNDDTITIEQQIEQLIYQIKNDLCSI